MLGRATRLKCLRRRHEAAVPASSPAGITSVCSAHPMVVEAAMRQAAADGTTVLIEATCNQVNHEGGYTGLTPVAFRDRVYRIADEVGFPRQQIVLGGDHLGPEPVASPARRGRTGTSRGDGGCLRRRRVREDPHRHQHGLPGRAGPPARLGNGRARCSPCGDRGSDGD